MKAFYQFLLRLFGWKTSVDVEIPPKCVICVAPHTSNWDFILGKIFYASIGGKPHFLIKKDWFFFPANFILKAIGGIPVERKKKSLLTEQMVEEFNTREHFQLAVTPEGTRKRTTQWKSGFYYIAVKAGVPITLAHIDYKKKEIGISRIFYPTGNLEQDMTEIKEFFKNFTAKHPEQFAI